MCVCDCVCDCVCAPPQQRVTLWAGWQEEVLHETAQMKRRAEAEKQRRRLERVVMADCMMAVQLVSNETDPEAEKLEALSSLVRRQPR